MTFDELYSKVLDILPCATMGEDNDGQLIIYTDKCEDPNGNVIDFIVPEEDGSQD